MPNLKNKPVTNGTSNPRLEEEWPVSWSNGFVLKKTRDGYSWTISVAAEGNSLQDMEEAINKAGKLDERLREQYGQPITAKLR